MKLSAEKCRAKSRRRKNSLLFPLYTVLLEAVCYLIILHICICWFYSSDTEDVERLLVSQGGFRLLRSKEIFPRTRMEIWVDKVRVCYVVGGTTAFWTMISILKLTEVLNLKKWIQRWVLVVRGMLNSVEQHWNNILTQNVRNRQLLSLSWDMSICYISSGHYQWCSDGLCI